MRRWPRITLRIAVASTSQRHAGTTLVASKQARHPLRGSTPDQDQRTRSEKVQCLQIGCSARNNNHKRGSGQSAHARQDHPRPAAATSQQHAQKRPEHHSTKPRTSQCLCHLGPTGGRTNPFMRSWTRHVEHGHPRPHSTHRVNVRIQGPRYPPIGPNMPSNSGTSPGTTTCPPAPHRHRGPPGTPRPPLACV